MLDDDEIVSRPFLIAQEEILTVGRVDVGPVLDGFLDGGDGRMFFPRERDPELGEPRGDGRLLNGRVQSLTQVTRLQIRGTLTFSIDIGCRFACVRNAGRSRSDLKPRYFATGAMRCSSHAPILFRLRK